MSELAHISILYVDDDPAVRDLTADMLEREDGRLAVATASSASDGLSHIATADIECFVSDYDMLGRTGIEFLHAVREEYPELPFIIFTGQGSEAVASDAFAGGATDYLQKGLGSEQYATLASKITDAVEEYRVAQTRQRRAQAMSTAEEGIAIVNEDGYYTEVNRAYADLYGSTQDALTGEHWTVTLPETEVAQMREEILPQLHERGQWTGEVVGQRVNGERYAKGLSLALLDDGGRICVARDNSKRQKRERAIEELHATARGLIGAETPDEVATVAVDALQDALELPVAGLHLYEEGDGLVPVAWTGKTEEIIGEPPTLGTDEGIIGSVFESGEVRVDDDVSTVPKQYNPDTDIRSQIVLPLAEHGVIIIASDQVAEFDDTDVELVRTVATHVTAALDRINRERALTEERRFVRQALDALDDLFYVIDRNGTVRRWNTQVSEVTGYTDAEIEGMNATAFFTQEGRSEVAEAGEKSDKPVRR